VEIPRKVVAVIQARMGSSRLPGKVLQDVGGCPMLGRVVGRLQRSRHINELLVATTERPADDPIVQFCNSHSVGVFRGQEQDVLDRYYRAAQFSKANVIVRITSDCPLIDPEITDKTIQEFLNVGPDYASNALVRTYPRGLDTEVVDSEALLRCWQQAALPYQRSHVTPYIYEHPESFRLHAVTGEHDDSSYRWTVDTPEDLEFVCAVYRHFGGKDDFSWVDVLDLLQRHPALLELNRHVLQKALHDG
jgi:spore coat polysaccharide biosynthesis protein SpsF